ncbi:MAG TPA: hypothetical protein VFU47_07720 [Armatimonadota bacterium]|nr:hypothetical protein [Armatimonadota bacterium]
MMKRARLGWIAAGMAAGMGLGAGLQAWAQKPGDVGFPYGDLKEVTLRGRLVSLGEELSRKYGAKRTAGAPAQWALALPEGQYYTFFENESYRKLIAGKPADGAVEITARHFPRSMLLEVVQFKPIAAETLKRRFHCSVCDIDSDDFGPCACCGKEMELVKP